MKYWEFGRLEHGASDRVGLLLKDGEFNNVLSISITESGDVCFMEECYNWYTVELSKKSAIAALNEAIEWIRNCEKYNTINRNFPQIDTQQ